jgi:hypothetical protein
VRCEPIWLGFLAVKIGLSRDVAWPALAQGSGTAWPGCKAPLTRDRMKERKSGPFDRPPAVDSTPPLLAPRTSTGRCTAATRPDRAAAAPAASCPVRCPPQPARWRGGCYLFLFFLFKLVVVDKGRTPLWTAPFS